MPLFYALKFLHLSNTTALVRPTCYISLVALNPVALQIWAPKVFTGIIASVTDCAVYRLTYLLFGRDYATVAVGAPLSRLRVPFAKDCVACVVSHITVQRACTVPQP